MRNASDISPTQWRSIINSALTEYKHDEIALTNFIAAVFEKSFDGNYEEPLLDLEGIMDDRNLQQLVDHIFKYCYKD